MLCIFLNTCFLYFHSLLPLLPSLLPPLLQNHPLRRRDSGRTRSVHVRWPHADGSAGLVVDVALARGVSHHGGRWGGREGGREGGRDRCKIFTTTSKITRAHLLSLPSFLYEYKTSFTNIKNIQHIFPEAPFAEASTICGHPCFLRDQWPDHYEGQGYEWDYYFNSYRAHILDGSVQPSLATRLASLSDLPRTRVFDLGRRETATIIERLAHRGDRVVLRGSPCSGYSSSSSSSSNSSSGGLAFKSGAVREGLTFASAVNEERKAQKQARAQAKEDEGGREEDKEEVEEEEEPALMAFWVRLPPCCIITMVQGGDRAAHESLLESMLAGESGSSAPSPRQQQQHQHHDSVLPPSSPSSGGGNGWRVRASSEWVALMEGPRSSLTTDAIVGYAKQQLQQCVEQGVCTYLATGSSWMRQRYYACLTCREFSVLQGNVGCCLSCSERCHKGHELVLREEGPFYCDCAIGGFSNLKCSCLGQGQGEEEGWRGGGGGHAGRNGHGLDAIRAAPHERKQQLLQQYQHQQHHGHHHHHH